MQVGGFRPAGAQQANSTRGGAGPGCWHEGRAGRSGGSTAGGHTRQPGRGPARARGRPQPGAQARQPAQGARAQRPCLGVRTRLAGCLPGRIECCIECTLAWLVQPCHLPGPCGSLCYCSSTDSYARELNQSCAGAGQERGTSTETGTGMVSAAIEMQGSRGKTGRTSGLAALSESSVRAPQGMQTTGAPAMTRRAAGVLAEQVICSSASCLPGPAAQVRFDHPAASDLAPVESD